MSEETPSKEPTWVLVLAALCGVWACGMVYFGYQELRDAQVVHGLFRGYAPPYERGDDWVLDPRGESLVEEVYARYGEDAAWIPQSPADAKAWETMTAAMGLKPSRHTPDDPLDRPTLLFEASAEVPRLFIGKDGEKYVVFEEGTGVLLLASAPDFKHGIRLNAAENRAW